MYHSNSTNNYKKDFVLRIWNQGYNVIPLSGKFPPCVPWKKYQTERVQAEEIVAWGENRFWSERKQKEWSAQVLNFGLPTGHKPYSDTPALVIVDSDDGPGNEIVKTACPDTPLMQKTGGGGWHRGYLRPSLAQHPYIGNRQKTLIDGKLCNIDLRADGGYIVCPGSGHPKTGQVYTEVQPWSADLIRSCPVYDPSWIVDERHGQRPPCKERSLEVVLHDDPDIEAEDLNQALAGVTIPLDDRIAQAKVYLDACPGTVEGTGADRQCTALASTLLYGFALLPDDAIRLLIEWGEKDSQLDKGGGYYPWTPKEISRKIEWLLKHSYHGIIGDRLHKDRGSLYIQEIEVEAMFSQEQQEEQAREQMENSDRTGKCVEISKADLVDQDKPASIKALEVALDEKINLNEWPDPLPVERRWAVPAFPLDAIELVPAYHDICSATAEHIQAPLDVSAVMGLAVLGLPLASRVEIAITRSAWEKAVIWAAALLCAGERKTPVFDVLRQPLYLWEAEQRKVMLGVVKEVKAQRNAARQQLKNIQEKLKKANETDRAELIKEHTRLDLFLADEEPCLPELLVDDVTPEALGEILKQQGGRIACLSDESTFLEVACGRYGDPNFENILGAWSGAPYRLHRIKREPIFVPQTYVTVGLCVQPDTFKKLAQTEAFESKGFLPRFLIAMPRSLVGHRKYIVDGDYSRTTASWSFLIRGLLDTYYSGNRFRRLQQSDEGFQLLAETFEHYEHQLADNKELSSLRAWVGKAIPGQLLRIAAVLHCASGNQEEVVPVSTLQAARAIIEYFLAHARVIYNIKEDDAALDLARKIRDYITRNRVGKFSSRYFRRHLWAARQADDTILDTAYDILVACNILRVQAGNKQTTNYVVHPQLYQ